MAWTPALVGLSVAGLHYDRAHGRNVVCMPARATMVTGQYVSIHGRRMNGVPLPVDAPSVAAELDAAGYRTALFGKAYFEPRLDPSRPALGSSQRFRHCKSDLLADLDEHLPPVPVDRLEPVTSTPGHRVS